MFNQIIEEFKRSPDRLKQAPQRARQRAHVAKETGKATLWRTGAQTLQTAESWFSKAPENLPVLSRVADAAEKLAHDQLESYTRVSLEDYTTLNARQVIGAIAELDHIELLRIERLERSTKNRKTVLAALDKALHAILDAHAA